MHFFVIFAIIILVLFVYFYKRVEVDLTLKYCEIFGEKAEKLRGKIVWITGASSGIGEYLAYELAGAGCKLILSARRKEELQRVKEKCSEIASAAKRNCDKDKEFLVLPLDVTKFDTHDEAVKTALNHFSQIDILVNNSGRGQRGTIASTELKVHQELFDINVMGTISMTKAVLPHMIKHNTGHIVVVSSIAGKFGFPSSGTYAATKHALQGFFFSLRTEVIENGIDVSIVCPGPIESAVSENAVTEKFGQSAGGTSYGKDTTHRMETPLFTKYMAIAMANKLDECWISPQPILLAMYVAQYIPAVFNWYAKNYALKQMKKVREFTDKKEN